ncbi:SDR family NAD(P)-dependent oxidoreductase [Labedella endophytica]|uniref:SDR family NAD(P)-dependent oxidoreductase n=1 Tax=Labedella endophytica TaxID=1523160 RepID=A0A3S0VBT3_9MICO|nr:SDR family NAD(P)-dependent oxidoreductase [Labedella endophytica]RUR01812.1 SDR family NAD(P)-dependent oxidoreductase [Labedella endophytica]
MTTSHRPLAVITGASSGIGEQFARRYAREGFDLLLIARSESTLRVIADDLSARHGVGVDLLVADLSRAADVTRVAEHLLTGLPRLDHLVNCAGASVEGDLADADETALRRMIDLNITALTLLTRTAIIRMRAAGSGTIINVASAAAYQPIPHLAAYSASKSFVLMLTEAMSEENRPFGLRILAVSPGDTETPMNPGAARGKRAPEEVVETAWKALPGRAPSVVDGRANSILAAVSTRLLPSRTRLRVAERMMRDKA